MTICKPEGEYEHTPITGMIGMNLKKKDGTGSISIVNVQEVLTRTSSGNGGEVNSTSGTVTYFDGTSNQKHTVTLSEFTRLIGVITFSEALGRVRDTHKESVRLLLGEIKDRT